jgi:hypothetical protein
MDGQITHRRKYPSDLSGDEWELIASHIPPQPRRHDHRCARHENTV